MLNLVLNITMVLFMFSCSSMKSGQYVYVETSSELKKVAKNYGITLNELKQANPKNSFQGKEWIFIPSKVGIVYLLNDTYVIEDYGTLGTGRFMWPVPNFYKVSSHFGPRGSKHHDGVDIPAPKGTPIVAVDHGVVIYSDNGIRGYGNMLVLAHGDDVFTVYAHNNKNLVGKGDKVSKGDMIAHVGNTGRSSGPHLHFEIRVKNKVRNPAQFLSNN
ncbi:MAG TPA: M23 family metallopeptidase [Bacteriovoracaceae bacterium]|nr:M23 family metallopeptidase [Bacteriovoracaceae bacterium]